jgi:glycosyltransferase involved in cell wall biosynthesis
MYLQQDFTSNSITMNTKVSVIIPTFNRKDHLQKTLSGFNDQTYRNFDLIVIEDGSSYNQKDEIKRMGLGYPLSYHYIKNRGRAGARNYGIEKTDGDLILFFDDHSQPCRNLLAEHVKNHWNHLRYGAYRGRIEFVSRYQDPVVYSSPHPLRNLHSLMFGNNPIVNFGTHNLSVKREVVEKIGGLDEEFTLYGAEDQEFGIRIKKAGYKIGYLPKALTYNVRIAKNTLQTLERAVASGKMAALLTKKHPEFKAQLGMNIFNRALYKNRKNNRIYRAFVENKIVPDGVTKSRLRFILYYYSFLNELEKHRER